MNHGGLHYKELLETGRNPDDILDFSVSINPCIIPDSVSKAVGRACLTRYPDSDSWQLTEALSEYTGRKISEIMPVSGTTEAISLLSALWAGPGDTVLITEPTYSDYRKSCELAGARVISNSCCSENNYIPEIHEMLDLVQKHKPSLVWLCNPNNPTAYYWPEHEYRTLLKAVSAYGGLMVTDEAYLNFITDKPVYNCAHESVIQLRSMTKDFGIPGLRIGYVMASEMIIEKLKQRQVSWSLSSVAQEAGKACLKEMDYYRQTWQDLNTETLRLRDSLTQMGFKPTPWHSNFFMVQHDEAEMICSKLTEQLIQVRWCASFGLPTYIRIGTRSPKDNDRLLEAVRKIVKF